MSTKVLVYFPDGRIPRNSDEVEAVFEAQTSRDPQTRREAENFLEEQAALQKYYEKEAFSPAERLFDIIEAHKVTEYWQKRSVFLMETGDLTKEEYEAITRLSKNVGWSQGQIRPDLELSREDMQCLLAGMIPAYAHPRSCWITGICPINHGNLEHLKAQYYIYQEGYVFTCQLRDHPRHRILSWTDWTKAVNFLENDLDRKERALIRWRGSKTQIRQP